MKCDTPKARTCATLLRLAARTQHLISHQPIRHEQQRKRREEAPHQHGYSFFGMFAAKPTVLWVKYGCVCVSHPCPEMGTPEPTSSWETTDLGAVAQFPQAT